MTMQEFYKLIAAKASELGWTTGDETPATAGKPLWDYIQSAATEHSINEQEYAVFCYEDDPDDYVNAINDTILTALVDSRYLKSKVSGVATLILDID
jgi:hypothetical protein